MTDGGTEKPRWFRAVTCKARGRVVGAALAISVSATSVSGCFGDVDRADFEAHMLDLGGGLTTAIVADGFHRIASWYEVDELTVTGVDLSPVETVHITVRNPRRPDELDKFVYNGKPIGDPTPVPVSAADNLDDRSFTVNQVPALSKVEKLVDDARAHSGVPDGNVTGISVNRTESVHISAMVESPRRRALVIFAPDGAFGWVQPL